VSDVPAQAGLHFGPGDRHRFWGECARCHQTEAKGAAARGPTHSRCEECHQPHAFERPTCDSCHSAIRGRLMHAVPKHQDCKTCHGAHENAPPTRAACMSCHTDRAKHYPDSPKCQSCHPFAGPLDPKAKGPRAVDLRSNP
jgi:hypothetical protein